MEQLFGDYLVKCKVLDVSEEKPAEAEEVKQAPTGEEEVKGDLEGNLDIRSELKKDEQEQPYCYEKVTIDDALVRTSAPFVAVLFTAEYCPPCDAFMPQFRDFLAEANRVAGSPKFLVLVVNCDRKEEQYKQHMAKMDPEWLAVPFE